MWHITDILDIKNLLGKNRLQPIPQYPADQLVIRSKDTSFAFNITFPTTLNVQYTYNGVTLTATYDNSHSGSTELLNVDIETDIIFTSPNSLQYADIPSGERYSFFAPNNTIQNFWYQGLKYADVVDLRNASSLASVGGTNNNQTSVVYVGDTTAGIRVAANAIINDSIYSDGVLWLKPGTTEAAHIRSVAENKGWRVYDL